MTMQQMVIFVVMPVVGYLLGSIPFAFVIGKAHGVDIRTVGSKNIGATNLGRTLGKRFFWQAFLLDAAKGFVPVLVAALLVRSFREGGAMLPVWAPLLTAVACVVGHLFPLFLGFRGGKGVATSFGAVLGFWPLFTIAGLGGGMVFVVVLMIYRYISLSSMAGAVAFVVFVALVGSWTHPANFAYLPWRDLTPLVVAGGAMALMIVVKHRGNIVRLMQGTEPQVGKKQLDAARMERP